jgi:hypothetical protein
VQPASATSDCTLERNGARFVSRNKNRWE